MDFDFLTEWRLRAPLDRIWARLRDVESWPAWWSSVAAVETLAPGDAEGIDAVHRLTWKTALPYRLAFETRVVRIEPKRRIEAEAVGELTGRGVWTLDPIEAGVCVRYRWQVAPHKPWMRRLAPLLRPVFAWNHEVVMERGRIGLEASLHAASKPG
ncbi:MAG: hypothetical protein JWO25_271 [Alphaproteobacteria bacterium]|nr:hypothetical protein [Alphaproteobacteria bacterium]